MLSTLVLRLYRLFHRDEANDLIQKAGVKHYYFSPIIQGESRMVVMFTSKNDVPLSRFTGIPNGTGQS